VFCGHDVIVVDMRQAFWWKSGKQDVLAGKGESCDSGDSGPAWKGAELLSGDAGPGTDKAHITAQYIDDLGKFVYFKFAKHEAHGCDSSSGRAGESRLFVGGCLDHSSELQYRERSAVRTNAGLPENGAAGRR
jgi:hypothetical protein